MKLPKGLVLILPMLIILAIVACDDNNNVVTQESGAQEPEAPAPGSTESKTTVTGMVIPQGDSSCTGGIEGFSIGDDITVEISPTEDNEGEAMVTINGDTLTCKTEMTPDEVDTPPITFITCTVTSVPSSITGLSNGDLLTIPIDFSGIAEGSVTKELAISTPGGCVLVGIEELTAN